MYKKGDFHIHSTHSDGDLRIDEIVELYGKLGFGAIAITDHLCETRGLWGSFAQKLNLSLSKERLGNYLAEIDYFKKI